MSVLYMKIPVEITVKDGKKEKTYKVEVREYTKEEAKKFKKEYREFNELLFAYEKLEIKLKSALKRQEYTDKLIEADPGNKSLIEQALKLQDTIDKISEELEGFKDKFKKAGIEDMFAQADFSEAKDKERYELLVSGKDKESLQEVAETKGYTAVMQAIMQAKADAEKKLLGE